MAPEQQRIDNDKTTHLVGTRLDLVVETILIVIPEGRVADQENVENHT